MAIKEIWKEEETGTKLKFQTKLGQKIILGMLNQTSNSKQAKEVMYPLTAFFVCVGWICWGD